MTEKEIMRKHVHGKQYISKEGQKTEIRKTWKDKYVEILTEVKSLTEKYEKMMKGRQEADKKIDMVLHKAIKCQSRKNENLAEEMQINNNKKSKNYL